MIPPLPTSNTEALPLFAKLWKHLTAEILDPDASKKSENAARNRSFPASEDSVPGTDSVLSDGDDDRGKSKADKVTLEMELRAQRVERMKRQILREVLRDVAYRVDEDVERQTRIPLPPGQRIATKFEGRDDDQQRSHHDSSMKVIAQGERVSSDLRDLLLLTTAYLNLGDDLHTEPRSTAEDEHLIIDEIAQPFKNNLPTISSAVGSSLLSLERSLTTLASLATDPDSPSPPQKAPYIPSLNPKSTSLISTLRPQTAHLSSLQTTTLPHSLATQTRTLQHLLRTQSRSLATSLTHLESSKHGISSRHTQSHALFLSTVASTMALKAQVLVLEQAQAQVVEGEGKSAQKEKEEWMRAKMQALNETENELEARVRALNGVLEEYEAVDPGVRVMRALGQRYRDVEGEIERVKADIERLEKGGKKEQRGGD